MTTHMSNDIQENEKIKKIDKGKMLMKHFSKRPLDVLRLGKATVLYGTQGLKARANELACNQWNKRNESVE